MTSSTPTTTTPPFQVEQWISQPAESLTISGSVRGMIAMLRAYSPAIARHFADVSGVLAVWTVALSSYSPKIIRQAAVALVSGPKLDIPDLGDAVAMCRKIDAEHSRKVSEQAKRDHEDQLMAAKRNEPPLSEEARAAMQAKLDRIYRSGAANGMGEVLRRRFEVTR